MRTPPWLMACALLFWGWENGFLLWGWLMAAAVELSRFSKSRWEFSDADLNRICDLCWALCVGSALLLYSNSDRTVFVFKLAQWMPFCFFPLILAQAYGNRPTMPLSVFWWLLRRLPNNAAALKSFNVSFAYFALCLLAASCSTSANAFFYPGITLLVAAALMSTRPRRVSNTSWISLFAVVVAIGYFSHQELKILQSTVEERLGIWVANLFRPSQQEPRELPTQIGSSSRLSLSGRIIFRVRPEPGAFAPSLLRQSTWDAYRSAIWSASNSLPTDCNPGSSDIIKLLPTNTLSSEIDVAGYYDGGRGVLALPHGTFQIRDLPYTVKTNGLGMATIENGPGLVEYKAIFGPGRSIDSDPADRDLFVDEMERPAVSNTLAELKLDGMTESQKIRAIHRFFATKFTYTLDPPRRHKLKPESKETWLGYFLTKSRRGHCQYFATATVLMLREAGIYARYVTGYAVPENSRHGDTYIVRERHAHAWAIAYNTNTLHWEEIDNTPADWAKADGPPPWWEPASDAMSNLYFQFSKWRWDRTSYARYSTWLLVPVVLYLAGRILFGRRRKNLADGKEADEGLARPGLDSELYLIDKQLAEAQLSRLPNEPLNSWEDRLEQAFPGSRRLRRIFQLHRCLRFDPFGLEAGDREALREEARQWMAEFTASQEAKKQQAQPVSR